MKKGPRLGSVYTAIVLGPGLFLAGVYAWYRFNPHSKGTSFAATFPEWFVPALVCYSLLAGFGMLVLGVQWWRLQAELRQARQQQKKLVSVNRELRVRNDTLSAMREVGIVLTQDVEPEEVFSKVLRITGYLVGSREAEEISIFVKDKDAGSADNDGHSWVPRAALVADKTYLGSEAAGIALDRTNVAECARLGKVLHVADNDLLDVAVPLVADREIVGVLKARVSIDGRGEERAERVRILVENLPEFARVVSLAIKTPDLYTRTIVDGLTGLYVKKHFMQQLKVYMEMARRYGEPLALLMIDIDHFKKINDTYGHLSGDLVLKAIAATLKGNIRAYATAYRYGGEELAVISPKTDLKQAATLAERLRKKVQSRRFYAADGQAIKVTISLGVAQFQSWMKQPEQFIAQADEALYQAKEAGRNRFMLKR